MWPCSPPCVPAAELGVWSLFLLEGCPWLQFTGGTCFLWCFVPMEGVKNCTWVLHASCWRSVKLSVEQCCSLTCFEECSTGIPTGFVSLRYPSWLLLPSISTVKVKLTFQLPVCLKHLFLSIEAFYWGHLNFLIFSNQEEWGDADWCYRLLEEMAAVLLICSCSPQLVISSWELVPD